MTLTLLALFLTLTGLFLVLNPKEANRVIKNLSQNPEDRFMAGILTAFIGLFVFSLSTHVFAFEWRHLMTFLGALIFLKGAVWVLLPRFVEKMVKKWNRVELLPFFGFLRLMFCLALIYIDTQVISL